MQSVEVGDSLTKDRKSDNKIRGYCLKQSNEAF